MEGKTMAQALKARERRPKITLVDDGEWMDFPPSPPEAEAAPHPATRPDESRAPSPADVPTQPAATTARPRGARRVAIAGAVLAALAAGAYFGDYWWTVGRFTVTT